MLFNLVCSLLVVLITLFLSTQGMVSALLALVTAAFASILAMGLMESLGSLVAGWRPDYSRGITFLLLFFLAFSACRIIADLLIQKDIKTSYLVNRIVGGVVGFFAAMVVVGTIILGVQMLPLGTTLLGYDQYASDNRMQPADGNLTGAPTAGASTWLGSERLVLAIYSGVSNRGLGGNYRSFTTVHPDLPAESYGYRNGVYYASRKVVLPENFEVRNAWISEAGKESDLPGIKAEAGRRLIMIRTAVKKNSKDELDTADIPDRTYFRITPTQVRMVTDKGHQYYPLGYLDRGRAFTPVNLVDSQLVEDYAGGEVIHDWVFQVPDDETPLFIEMKQLARAELTPDKFSKTPVAALAAGKYPQRGYKANVSTLAVTVSGKSPFTEGKVYVLRTTATVKDASSELRTAYAHIKEVAANEAWPKDKPGVPSLNLFTSLARDNFINSMLVDAGGGADAGLQWERALKVLMYGPIGQDGPSNIANMPEFIRSTIEPIFAKVATGSALITSAEIKDGRAELRDIPVGTHAIFVWGKSQDSFYYWIEEKEFKAKSDVTATYDPGNAKDPKLQL